MATAAKSGASRGTAATEKDDAPPVKKSKKKLIFIILALLLIGGGAATYFLMKPTGTTKDEAQQEIAPKYVALGTFTTNLVHENGADRYLQVAISIKVSRHGLEEKIKARDPEILDHINLLLSTQLPSVLATLAGKNKLAQDIKTQIELVLGLRSASPTIQSASAPVVSEPEQSDTGIDDVLFTSFIIQ